MGSVIFEAVSSHPNFHNEWLVNFRVPRAGGDGGTLTVVSTQEAATALARVLNYATAMHDQAVVADAALSSTYNGN